jgi:hypothetical protein
MPAFAGRTASPKPCLASKELILPVGDCGLTGLVEQGQNPPGILLPEKNSGHRQWAQSWVAGDPEVPYPDAVEASESFFFENLPNSRRTEGRLPLFESFADLVDGMILFAKLDDQVARG